MDLIDLLERAWQRGEDVLGKFAPADVDRPSANDGWTVKQTLNHAFNVCRMMSGVNEGRIARLGEHDLVGDGTDVLALWRVEGAKNVASWRAAGLEGERAYQWATFPAPAAAALNLSEVLLHCWDVASAAGTTYAFEPDLAEPAWQVYSAAPLDGMRQAGELGPEIPVAADAPVGARLLALTGRQQ